MNETNRLQSDQKIEPSHVRYIKLGPSDAWANESIANGRLAFGHADVPHSLAEIGNWEAVKAIWTDDGQRSASKASDFLREVKDFYTLGSDCLWITFANGRMWWAYADSEVVPFDHPSQAVGARYRRVLGSWQSTSLYGKPLILSDLSTKLTMTGAYRQTLCKVAAADYAVRVINGEDDPAIRRARTAKHAFIQTLTPLIQSLHETDFEVLTDLIFSRLGWVRVSSIGGSQKDTDILLEQPTTRARALVQVKSSADQTVLDDYATRLGAQDGQALFFVCHSPKGALSADGFHIWTGLDLAERVVEAGLTDWLFERAA